MTVLFGLIPVCLTGYLLGSLVYHLTPAPGFTAPLQLDYGHNSGKPTAHVPIDSEYYKITPRTVYSMQVDLTIPDSIRNVEAGATMLKASFNGNLETALATDTKIIPFQYSSLPLRILRMLCWAPLYIFGFYDETQHIQLKLFNDPRKQQLTFTDIDMPKNIEISLSRSDFHVYDGSVRIFRSSIFFLASKMYHDLWPYMSTMLLAIVLGSIYFSLILYSLKKVISTQFTSYMNQLTTESMESKSSYERDVVEESSINTRGETRTAPDSKKHE